MLGFKHFSCLLSNPHSVTILEFIINVGAENWKAGPLEEQAGLLAVGRGFSTSLMLRSFNILSHVVVTLNHKMIFLLAIS